MKIYISILILSFLLTGQKASSQPDKTTIYLHASKSYNDKDYLNAAKLFDQINSFSLSQGRLYQGACIYALNNETGKAFELLNFLADKKYYSNYEHLSTDTDLTNLHHDPKWMLLLGMVKHNSSTVAQRKLATIYNELTKAKQLLAKDNGKLWGSPIWNDDIFVLDYDNTIYAIKAFPGSSTDNGKLFYAHVPANTFVFVNTVQSYQGKEYATVLSNYLYDNSVTVIHELFHLLQLKNIKLNGDAIKYLDHYDARELLRLEYQALRNTLNAVNSKSTAATTKLYLEDALLFRKLRQNKYKAFLDQELQIETLEGLANYTGFALSTSANKYESAIEEIYQRENSETYTRPFPYATGVAYGLIFDHLKMKWKKGLKDVYNFLAIYEKHKVISTSEMMVVAAKGRSNYEHIHQEEEIRHTKNEILLRYYQDLLLVKPTLKVKIGENYGRTFNMNGTIEIPGTGTVYSSITGKDKSGRNFGNFTTKADKASLGTAGVLMLNDAKTFIFPTPFKIEGNKIVGETYEIDLNDGWNVQKTDEIGNYVIRQQ